MRLSGTECRAAGGASVDAPALIYPGGPIYDRGKLP